MDLADRIAREKIVPLGQAGLSWSLRSVESVVEEERTDFGLRVGCYDHLESATDAIVTTERQARLAAFGLYPSAGWLLPAAASSASSTMGSLQLRGESATILGSTDKFFLREVQHSSSSVSSSNPEDAPFESMITRFVSE